MTRLRWREILQATKQWTDDKELDEAVEHLLAALGNADKQPTPSELPNREVARKSIVAARAIARGEELTEENLTTKRPGTGISPMRWEELIGTRAIRDFQPDELIEI